MKRRRLDLGTPVYKGDKAVCPSLVYDWRIVRSSMYRVEWIAARQRANVRDANLIG